MEQVIINFIIEMAQKYPVATAMFASIGVLRTVFKPFMALLKTFVVATPSPSDDLLLAKLESSKAYKAFAWFIDYIASIKLPGYDK